MSTSPPDAGPILSLASAAGQPARRTESERQLALADRAARAPSANAAADEEEEIGYQIAWRRDELCGAFGLVYRAYVRAGLE
jgi:hypothetical protein